MDEKLNWLVLAEKFASDGDPRAMKAVARELFDFDRNSAEGPAIMAESALYLGNFDEAEILAQDALNLEGNNLRARLVLGGLVAEKFELAKEFKLLNGVINDCHHVIENLNLMLKNYRRRFSMNRKQLTAEDEAIQKEIEIKISLAQAILHKALCWISNGLYISGEPLQAAESLYEASQLTENNDRAAELYSKHLFLRNYRDLSPKQGKDFAEKYNIFFEGVPSYTHERGKFSPDKKLKIGYISPDFRQHAVANFLLPFLRDFDNDNFSVVCYQTGKKDAVTERLKRNKVSWRDLSGRSVRTSARLINEDHVDILVDLSGHTQNSCLPIMALKPAPVQISAIGYTATTGLNAIDFFLSDSVCLPGEEQPEGFTEKVLRVENCHFCYSPGVVREMPTAGVKAPILQNDYITFGSFNNFAKVSDEVLHTWRAILEKIPDSILVIKSKICSIDSGKEILKTRLKKFNFPMNRIELRPYSPDYLEQYRDIDIALDTFPYTGGLTTCEALYMGVPVITLRGKTHGSKISTSILSAADLNELIANSQMDYIKKAVQVAKRLELVAGYHAGLREHLLKSNLMDSQKYIRSVEKCYREAWKIFCDKKTSKPKFGK